MPVTSEIALIGGVELNGFPKIITNIEFINEGEDRRCTVTENEKHILTLQGPVLPTRQGDYINFKSCSIRNNTTIAVNFRMLFHEFAESRKTSGVTLTLGDDHYISQELKSIDLSEKAFLYQFSPSCELLLSAPRNVSEY